MNFDYSDKIKEYQQRLQEFMDSYIYPLEEAYETWNLDPENLWTSWPEIEALKEKAKQAGLWNLFLPLDYGELSPGLTNLEYAPLAEMMGRVLWSSEVFNCSAPDTGNMEVLAKYGTKAQQEQWLTPLMNGEIRSSFLMTEPDVASSDATNIETSIVRQGEEYAINGRKWWSSGAMDPNCEIFIVMGKTDREADRHRQQSMILVPKNTPGVEIVRPGRIRHGRGIGKRPHMALGFSRIPLINRAGSLERVRGGGRRSDGRGVLGGPGEVHRGRGVGRPGDAHDLKPPEGVRNG